MRDGSWREIEIEDPEDEDGSGIMNVREIDGIAFFEIS